MTTPTLLGWLGCETAPVKKVSPRSLSPILTTMTKASTAAKSDGITILGVLGTRSKVTSAEFHTDVLAPLIEVWGNPDEIVMPLESDSSAVLQAWAAKQGIPVRLVSCDWTKHGRRAAAMRDACIQREATHFLLLQGPRSNALTALAGRLHRKRRPVLISERPGQAIRSVAPSEHSDCPYIKDMTVDEDSVCPI